MQQPDEMNQMMPKATSHLNRIHYVDMHCHCLTGIDDGPSELCDSLMLCEALVKDGVSTVIATPHQLGRYADVNDAALIREKVAQLNHHLEKNQICLKIYAGGEVRVDERLCELLKSDHVLTLADGGKYVLLELPLETYVDIEPIIVQLSEMGIQSIIAHPERYEALARHPEIIQRWLRYSVFLQITAGSLLGQFGSTARHVAWNYLSAGWCHFVATDAHHQKWRGPCMNAAFQAIRLQFGWDFAKLVCVDNPARVIEGEDILELQIGNERNCEMIHSTC